MLGELLQSEPEDNSKTKTKDTTELSTIQAIRPFLTFSLVQIVMTSF